MPLGAARLNKRVTFQREVQTPDGMGGFTRVWGQDLTVWAALMPGAGSETVTASRLQEVRPDQLTVRSSRDTRRIDATWRVLVDGKYCQVRAIANPDQVNRFLDVTIEGGVPT